MRRLRGDGVAEGARDGVAGRGVMVDGLAEGDEGGEGVAHHRQLEGPEPGAWKGGEFEG